MGYLGSGEWSAARRIMGHPRSIRRGQHYEPSRNVSIDQDMADPAVWNTGSLVSTEVVPDTTWISHDWWRKGCWREPKP